LSNEPIPSIEQHYQIISMIAPSVDINAINQAVQSFNFGVTDKNMTITNFNTEKDGAVYPTVEGLKGAIAAARNSDIQPYVDNVKNEPLMTTLPKKGKIVKETRNDHLGYTELQLSNGARVILKKTDFKQDEILMSAFQRGGQSLYNEKDYANLHMLNNLNYFTGLGQFSNSDVSKALAGKQVNVNLNITGFTDNIFGNSTVKDLETLFQLTYLKFTALAKDEKKFNQVMSQWEAELKNKDLVPMSALFDTINCVRYNYNWRNRPYGIEDMKQANLDRIMEIAKERTANAAGYTFLFVGSFDDAIIRQYIEQYIASLPAKKGKKFNWNNTTSMPQGQVVKHFTHKMSDPQCHEVVAWH
jgi:zinc protease